MTFGLGAATKGKLDGRVGIQVTAPRGGTYKDQVLVVNLSYTPLTLDIYPADVHNDANGRLQPDVQAAKPRDLGAWVTMTTPSHSTSILVPAKGQVLVPVSVHVPKNAAIGDHVAALVVGLTTKAQGQGQRATDLDIQHRVGLQLAVRVGGQLRPQLSVAGVSASYSGVLNPFGKGTARVTYTVRNDGNVRLGGTQQLYIHGLFGTAAPPVSLPQVPVLLPGGTATFSVDVPSVSPMGLLSADITVVPSVPAGDSDPALTPATGSVRFWAVSWTLLALVLLLSALGAWWVRHRRRRPPASSGRREVGAQPDLVTTGGRH